MKYDIITYSLILYIKREIIAMFSTKLIINEFNDKKKNVIWGLEVITMSLLPHTLDVIITPQI